MSDRLPSLSDFATGYNSAYPELWENCVGAWAPSLGPTGDIIPDRTELTRAATVINPTPGTNYEVNGGAYCFNANPSTSTYVQTDLNRANTVTALTWTWWGRLHSGGAFYVSDLTSSRGMGVDNLGTILYLNYPGAANYAQIALDVRGRWVHYAYRFDGNAGTDAERIQLFVDGTQRTLTYIGATPTSLLTTTEPLQIGRRPYSVTITPGLWDDFRAYSVALDPARIRLLASQRGIAYTPRRRRFALEQAAGGITGDLNVTLAAATLSADGTVADGASGNLNVTLAPATLAADGTITQPPITADLSVTLQPATLIASGTGPAGEQTRGGFYTKEDRKRLARLARLQDERRDRQRDEQDTFRNALEAAYDAALGLVEEPAAETRAEVREAIAEAAQAAPEPYRAEVRKLRDLARQAETLAQIERVLTRIAAIQAKAEADADDDDAVLMLVG